MNLESPKIIVEKTQQEVYEFFSDVKNFKTLMPVNINKFEVLEDDKFLFALKGMPEIVLKKKEMIAPNKFVLGAAGGKLDFSLIGNIVKLEDNKSEIQLSFNGNFNPMLSMMIKGPLGKFIETLATNLPEAV